MPGGFFISASNTKAILEHRDNSHYLPLSLELKIHKVMKKALYGFLIGIFLIAFLVTALFAIQFNAHVTINVDQTMAVMPLEGIGACAAVYEGNLADPASAALAVPQLKAAGIGALRFPGGSYADIYNWQTAAPMNGCIGWMPSQNNFTNFMNQLVIPSGAEAIITCNYGSNTNGTNAALDSGGDPNFAAAWVAFANVTNHWGIKYWEIGNEIGGNGWSNYFGAKRGWELDMHRDKSPMAYGSNVVLFARAMKAVDPTIKIGVGISQPGVEHDTNASYPYNQCVLTNCAGAIDFVIIHWYPGSTPARTLAAPGQISSIVQSTRVELTNYLGAARAGRVDIAITETSAGTTNNTGVVASLFAADDYLSWIENGIMNVGYQEYHNDILLTDNQHPGQAYYGAQMAHLLANVGDILLKAASDRGKLRVHAALRRDGKVGIMLINEDHNFSKNVHVTINGTNLAASGVRYQFGLANFVGNDPAPSHPVASNSVSGLGNSFSVKVPAYTMVDLLIPILTDAPSETSKTNSFHSK